MKTQVRILVLLAAVALAAGWWELRRGNAALEVRLAASGAPSGQVRP